MTMGLLSSAGILFTTPWNQSLRLLSSVAYVDIHTCVRVCMCVYIYIYIEIDVCIHTSISIYIYIYTHIHTRTHVCIST